MSEATDELRRLRAWIKDGKGYNRDDAPDEIARAIDNRVRELEGDQWCAWCAKWGDHTSGSCEDLKQAQDVTSSVVADCEDDTDQAFSPMPSSCQQLECSRSAEDIKLVNKNGFMVCPRCGGSYGSAELANTR